MSDISQLLNSLKVESASVKSFVHYSNDTGVVHKITSRPVQIEDCEVLEVPYDAVKDAMSGKRKLDEFVVEYDAALKHMVVKEITFEDDVISVNDKLFKIGNDSDPDLTVIWDRNENLWEICLSDQLQSNKHLHKRPADLDLMFSITKQDDPNILFKTVTINLKKLLSEPYQFYFTPDDKALSIYTVKYFNSYQFRSL